MSTPGRARRTTAKVVNYAKEQEFSDAEDLFESEPDEEPQSKRATAKRAAPRRAAAASATTTADADAAAADYIHRPVYTEKGYDPSLPPLRERFSFLPEYEDDGTAKIELIVGRRPVDEKEDDVDDDDDGENGDSAKEEEKKDDDASDDAVEETPKKRTRGSRTSAETAPSTPTGRKKRGADDSSGKKKKGSASPSDAIVEYEYLVKFKGKSYLHLEWKTGADLESMNRSAKGMYRRFLKKLAQGTDEDLENPEFDPSYIVPEKVLDEADQEVAIELTDKELLKWEKERDRELAEQGDDNDDEEEKKTPSKENGAAKVEEEKKESSEEEPIEWPDEIDLHNIGVDFLRKILKGEEPFYPVIKGSDNPYRDGYITEPPKKPRASYLFFQCTMRHYFAKKNPKAVQSELMSILGEAWRTMDEKDKQPFQILADEESKLYDREKAMLEKAQKPNGVWQPLRRCREVLERLASDSYADIFLEPVSLEDFPDYEEHIDVPMDLGTIRHRLKDRKYMAPEQFARDMRRVWNNCKIYNQHGSAIWHVADYMSKQFERLYHAWVLEFRERYLRWADPRARPWEHSCRVHDGKCGTPDDKMVLCDHCDGMYGLKCLTPPLKKVPSKAWHCPDCKPKLRSAKGARMLSAVAENAARKRAEFGDLPTKKITQTMFLVKWQGLGYEFCSWETREDVGNDALISEFHKLNHGYSDEADLPEHQVDEYIANVKHVNAKTAGGSDRVPNLRSQLYAQNRGLQFVKFGMEVPEKVSAEMGPKTTTACLCPRMQLATDGDGDKAEKFHPREVIECVSNMTMRVALYMRSSRSLSCNLLPPPLTAEYDVVVPITSKGLMMNVGEISGAVAFLGYRKFPDGSRGPSELMQLIRNFGDIIIAIDGHSTVNKSFKEVINMLKESGKNKFAYMRFLENRGSGCDPEFLSVGSIGRYAYEELQRKFLSDRQRMIVQRKADLVGNDTKGGKDDDESAAGENSDDDSEVGSEGSFEPDSDEDLGDTVGNVQEVSPSAADREVKTALARNAVPAPTSYSEQNGLPNAVSSEQNDPSSAGKDEPKPTAEQSGPQGLVYREETTRSLGLRLLDVDLGYSSDEGGEEDCAYFIDGVDETFTPMEELEDLVAKVPKSKGKKKQEASQNSVLPASSTEFSALGERAKLAAAVALSQKAPSLDDFESFPEITKHEEEAALPSPSKSTKRSTVKVEQINPSNGEIVHVWANVEAASATLQLPLVQLKSVLRGEYDEELGEEVGGFKWGYALTSAKVTAGQASPSRGGGGRKAKEAWLQFRDKLYDPSDPHIYKNGNRLRDYQVDGVNWLASTWYKRHGCVLADEMGLGKTVQIVCYIEHLFRVEKIRRPFLVVVPLSTVEHWRREFSGWTDLVCCIYHDRQRVWRDVLREYEWYFEDRPHTAEFLKFDVLVTTYDTLIGDFDVISQIPFRVAVVDEAHRLRNQKGKLLECMKEISAKGTMHYGFQSRILMSGTPLQNDLTELWTLLNFIEPLRFPDLDVFQMNFGNMANRSQVEALQQMISPFMLRRVKEDVAKDIPSKEETVIDVELTAIQKQYYRAIFEHNHAFLNMGASRNSAPKLMNIQMELRKVCNHPFLLDGVEHRETDRQFKEFLENGVFEGKSPEEQQHLMSEHGFVMTSGKMVLMDKLLPKLRAEGHKVLIFSQMVKMLDLISEYCEFRNFKYERLDGRVRGTERQKAIDRFNSEDDSFLFLLSTRAGGVGINLTAADTVLIFDSDWNPQNDVQAQARCHRIGQTKDVRIYRLVTSRSFEQEMFDRASLKLGLEQAVLGTFEKEQEDDKPSQEEMEQLLKKGAYALLGDDNDEMTQNFVTDDIDSILAKRTRTRVVEGAKTASWLNKQGMVVSRSKFGADTGGETLDMDDPQFWQKVMPDFVTPSLLLQKLRDMEDDIEGRKRGPGRGRWREKRAQEAAAKAAAEAAQNTPSKDDDGATRIVGDGENGMKPEEKPVEGEGAKGKKDEVDDAQFSANADVEGKKDEADDAKSSADADDEGKKDEADDANSSANADDESKKDEADDAKSSANADDESDEESEVEEKKKKVTKLSKTNIQKLNKFMSDLKSMMESLEDDDDEEGLSKEERDACQKLLLTVSVKQKLFTEAQRRVAKKYLERFEGGRRRRCRTSEQTRFQPGVGGDDEPAAIRKELMITGKKRRKRRTREEMEAARAEAEKLKQKRRASNNSGGGGYVGEDGYLHHSDSEDDWSTVGDDIYQGAKKDTISRKQAKLRRVWGAGDDAAAAAGRMWPVFPRPLVKKVLTTVIEKAIEYDEERGGVFSVPVPKDEFPEYYEQIKKPMDYGTMKKKLENGEYRSAQSMQKDFILIMQNCRQFNANNSDIVRAAREQHLLRPKFLKEAAEKHDLFLAEDGSVLEIVDEKPGSAKKKASGKKKKKPDGEGNGDDEPPKKKQRRGKKSGPNDDEADTASKKSAKKGKAKKKKAKDDGDGSDGDDDESKKKPRIKIKVKAKRSKKKAAKRKRGADTDDDDETISDAKAESDAESVPKSKRRKKNGGKASAAKKVAVSAKKDDSSSDDDVPLREVAAKSKRRKAAKEADVKAKKPESVFLDLDFWKSSRESLDGSFKAARKNFFQVGPWELPQGIPEEKFTEVAYITLDKMNKHDGYSVFAKEVDDEEAPGYSEVVKFPMDFSKMRTKIRKGEYGAGSDAAAAFFKDFKLVFDNCYLYNDDGNEVTEEASRILGLLPETYVAACIQVREKSSN